MLTGLKSAQEELFREMETYRKSSEDYANRLAEAQKSASADLAGAGETIRDAGEKLAVSYERFVTQTSGSLNGALKTFSDSLTMMTVLLNQKMAEAGAEQISTADQLGEIQRLLTRMSQIMQAKGAVV